MSDTPRNLPEVVNALRGLQEDLKALTERMEKGYTALDDRLERVEEDRVPYAIDPDLHLPPFPRCLRKQGYTPKDEREDSS